MAKGIKAKKDAGGNVIHKFSPADYTDKKLTKDTEKIGGGYVTTADFLELQSRVEALEGS